MAGDVSGSGKSPGLGKPFGYLKPSSSGAIVNLVVMPYDYPTLATLMQQYLKVHKQKPPKSWVAEFQAYVASIPPYYLPVCCQPPFPSPPTPVSIPLLLVPLLVALVRSQPGCRLGTSSTRVHFTAASPYTMLLLPPVRP